MDIRSWFDYDLTDEEESFEYSQLDLKLNDILYTFKNMTYDIKCMNERKLETEEFFELSSYLNCNRDLENMKNDISFLAGNLYYNNEAILEDLEYLDFILKLDHNNLQKGFCDELESLDAIDTVIFMMKEYLSSAIVKKEFPKKQ